jgi:hypothetical protein
VSKLAPFANIFGNTVKARIVEELMADPSQKIDIGFIGQLCSCSRKTVRKYIKELEKDGLIYYCDEHKAYEVDFEKKSWAALTLLAFALNDDIRSPEEEDDGFSCSFDRGVYEYTSGRPSIFMPFVVERWGKE